MIWNYFKEIIDAYKSKRISRKVFIEEWRQWQKSVKRILGVTNDND